MKSSCSTTRVGSSTQEAQLEIKTQNVVVPRAPCMGWHRLVLTCLLSQGLAARDLQLSQGKDFMTRREEGNPNQPWMQSMTQT